MQLPFPINPPAHFIHALQQNIPIRVMQPNQDPNSHALSFNEALRAAFLLGIAAAADGESNGLGLLFGQPSLL